MTVRPARWQIWSALLVIYIVWGSTYLAIKIAVRTLPPLLSGGARFVAASLLLAAIVAATGRSLHVSRQEVASALLLGMMLLTFGVGIVQAAETRIDSSVAAMIAGSVPLQIVVWRTIARERIAPATRLAAAVGLAGLALIVVPGGSSGGSTAVGLALMVGATVSWSTGSYVSRRLSLPADPFVATVYEMLGGGIALILVGLMAGEGIHRADLEASPILAWLYLVTAGSLVGFTAYAWLLRHVPISKVVTHQYVNPLVAIGLGSLILDERLTATTLAGAAIVVTAVFVTVQHETRRPTQRPETEPVDPCPETVGSR